MFGLYKAPGQTMIGLTCHDQASVSYKSILHLCIIHMLYYAGST